MGTNYTVLVYKEHDSGLWRAVFPQFDNLTTVGVDRGDVLRNAARTLRHRLEWMIRNGMRPQDNIDRDSASVYGINPHLDD
jgi:hypothetical protein